MTPIYVIYFMKNFQVKLMNDFVLIYKFKKTIIKQFISTFLSVGGSRFDDSLAERQMKKSCFVTEFPFYLEV